jgi:hypothetical protein
LKTRIKNKYFILHTTTTTAAAAAAAASTTTATAATTNFSPCCHTSQNLRISCNLRLIFFSVFPLSDVV